MAASRPLTVLHLAPHPDDEAIGAPATLLALRDAGHRVINLACSLGQPDQVTRRRMEVERACRRAGWELIIHDPLLAISRDDDLAQAQAQLRATVQQLADAERVDIVVAPSPHDGHHGHEVVGRAARDAVIGLEPSPCLWLWGLWADLPFPTLYSGFGRRRMWRVLRVLSSHRGEISRNDYRLLVRARATANRVLGCERVFDFGAKMREQRYAELLTEALVRDGVWWTGVPRELDPRAPLLGVEPGVRIGWWLDQASPADRLREQA
jgi:hypothetical protein